VDGNNFTDTQRIVPTMIMGSSLLKKGLCQWGLSKINRCGFELKNLAKSSTKNNDKRLCQCIMSSIFRFSCGSYSMKIQTNREREILGIGEVRLSWLGQSID
jgi:hypothetical protein